MPIRLYIDQPASGAWNMAFDEALLESAADRGLSALRFYAWETPTLSLGYFQQAMDRRQHSASRCCPLVRRASGGGAIVHDREITYGIVLPPDALPAKRHLQLYEIFHATLIETLADWNIRATLCAPSASRHSASEPFLCFQRRAAGDVLLGEHKIAGSAQRRLRGAVLQHGSLLLARSAAAPELPGINDLYAAEISSVEIIAAWLEKLALKLEMPLIPDENLADYQRRAAQLVAEKYAAPVWTLHRGRIPASCDAEKH